MACVVIQVHIQHGAVEDLRTNQGERLTDRCGSDHGLASDVGQHAFENQQFILGNEGDSPIESNLSNTSHCWYRNGHRAG